MHLHVTLSFAPVLPVQHSGEWIASALVLLVAFVLWRLTVAGIERFYARRFISRFIPRVSTYRSLSRSVAGALLLCLLVIELLHIWSVNVTPALWSATVISAVIAFGAQSLVRDVLTGIFFLFEDTYDVGDVVEFTTTNGNVAGTVDAISLRLTRIIDQQGHIVSVPNGSVVFVTNLTRLPSRVSIKLIVPLRGDVLELRKRILETVTRAAPNAGVDPNSIAVRLDDSGADTLTFAIEFEANRAVARGAESTMREQTLAGLQAAGVLPGASPSQAGAG